MTSDSVRVLAISGSLRKGSFNTALVRAAIEIAEAEALPVTITVADIHAFPLYDDDLLKAAGFPPPVQQFREAIAAADALLFATPEYNFSMSGVLKNAIDWASRAPAQPLADKPFAMMGASGGMSGTMRAQYHLRQTAVFLDMHAVNRPEVFVRNAKSVFDDDLRLTDDPTRKVIQALLVSLIGWTHRLAKKTD